MVARMARALTRARRYASPRIVFHFLAAVDPSEACMLLIEASVTPTSYLSASTRDVTAVTSDEVIAWTFLSRARSSLSSCRSC